MNQRIIYQIDDGGIGKGGFSIDDNIQGSARLSPTSFNLTSALIRTVTTNGSLWTNVNYVTV